MITSSNSLCRERDAQSLRPRFSSRHVRYRAVPRTNRSLTTANTPIHSATSSTTEPPACAPLLPWQCSGADALPGVGTDVANLGPYAPPLALPPPTREGRRRRCEATVGRVAGVSDYRGRHSLNRVLLPGCHALDMERCWRARQVDRPRRASCTPPAPASQQLLDALQIRSRVAQCGSANGRERGTRTPSVVGP
jgi:hypothetical protein